VENICGFLKSSKSFSPKEHIFCVTLSIDVIVIETHELSCLVMLTSEKGFRKAESQLPSVDSWNLA